MVSRAPELWFGIDTMGRRVLVIMTCENVLPVLFPVLTEVKGTDGAYVEAVFNFFEVLPGEVHALELIQE